MSNHLAIAAATQTLALLLDHQLRQDVDGSQVTISRPDAAVAAEASAELRLFLYRVEPNSAWRAADLPTRSPGGQFYERPQVGLNLHFLLCCVGDEAQLVPHRLLASAVRTLAAHPLLSSADIQAMVAAVLATDPQSPLALTDLADQVGAIRLTPLPLDLDQMSTLWSSFFETPYRLSMAYEAAVVVLTPDVTAGSALPVLAPMIGVHTIRRPAVAAVEPAAGPGVPIQVGTDLVITGTELKGEEQTVVAFDRIEVVVPGDAASGTRITVTVPATVRSGVRALRVLHRRLAGDPPVWRPAGQSNLHPVVIQPRLAPLAANAVHDTNDDPQTGLRSGTVTLTVEPPVGSRQQVVMLLNPMPGGGRSYVFAGERRDGAGQPEVSSQLDLRFTAVPPGAYLLRVAVDGAESPLTIDTTVGSPTEGRYHRPQVVL